jgi:hypothetical protein
MGRSLVNAISNGIGLLCTKIGGVASRPTQAAVLLVTLLCFTIPSFVQSLNKADTLKPSWSSAEFWVQSADCARTTGVVLAICRDSGLVPIADVTAGDDPGQALALDAYSILTQKAVTQNDVSRLNSLLNYIGIALLAAFLFHFRFPVISLLVLTGGSIIANQFHSLGPHPGHFGVACFVAILPLSVVALSSCRMPERQIRLWVAIGLLVLGTAMLFREAIGLMGVVASLLAVGVNYVRSVSKMRSKAFIAIGLACAILMTIAVPKMILRARDVVYNIPPSTRMEQHGAWHNLYIGLGAVSNPFGIAWNDANGVEAVKKVDPSIVYLSNEYYTVLRRQYFRIVISHPLEVLKIYFEKLAIAVNIYAAWFIVLIVLITDIFLRIRHRVVGRWRTSELLLIVCGMFVLMFWAQAMLFNFTPLYLFPVKLFLLLGFGGWIELLASSAYPRRRIGIEASPR